MFRFRRHRTYIVLAVVTVGLVYHFTSIGVLEVPGVASVEQLKSLGHKFREPGATEPSTNDADTQDAEEDKTLPPIRVDSGHHDASLSTGAAPEQSAIQGFKGLKGPMSENNNAVATQGLGTSMPMAEDINPVGLAKTKTKGPEASRTSSTSKADRLGLSADPTMNVDGGEGRKEVIGSPTSSSKIHWSLLPEHFPVPTESLIQLPSGKPKTLPKIQHDFTAEKESQTEKSARKEKLSLIKETFKFSWSGYRKKAWMQDELSPISGRFRNPFCGWGATLVDTLDTLWMLDLKDEFEEALEAVKEIDFTTSMRNDIPLFETVIRYLGGLIAAYDISDGAHRILLDKAVELADILMGAFDTPNRMPMTYYLWKPTFASQPHRARARVVLAELGSLSVEFTRLAQITKEARYYDAIARITNEFEIWQPNTKVPGLWPQSVDASGCKKPDTSAASSFPDQGPSREKPLGGLAKDAREGDTATASDTKEPSTVSSRTPTVSFGSEHPEDSVKNATPGPMSTSTAKSLILRREAGGQGSSKVKATTSSDSTVPGSGSAIEAQKKPECKPQGLASPPNTNIETFPMGGQADSTYEYLPKEYILLGGLEDKYRTMYEMAADATVDNLLYRPMIPDEERHLLYAGLLQIIDNKKLGQRSEMIYENTHLTCFVGGMFALGAKVFNRKKDLDLAKKLTDGCVWAYEATTTGIMPEIYRALACDDEVRCPWNETLWQQAVDPLGDARETKRLEQQKILQGIKDTKAALKADDTTKSRETPAKRPDDLSTSSGESSKSATLNGPGSGKDIGESSMRVGNSSPKSLGKRQLGELDDVVVSQSLISTRGEELSSSMPRTSAKIDVDLVATESYRHPAASANPMETRPKRPTQLDGQPFPESRRVPLPSGSPSSTGKDQPLVPTREEYVKDKVENERLPLGMTSIQDKSYLLRPEAIESVFIMYRVTGDIYWRDKGWEMFKAVQKHTTALYGASAIQDVTAVKPQPKDQMESFWLAETLKYYYLLFSDPDLVSLDDYVLNTEAHPFKIPKP